MADIMTVDQALGIAEQIATARRKLRLDARLVTGQVNNIFKFVFDATLSTVLLLADES